jgi:hypothetical protein
MGVENLDIQNEVFLEETCPDEMLEENLDESLHSATPRVIVGETEAWSVDLSVV